MMKPDLSKCEDEKCNEEKEEKRKRRRRQVGLDSHDLLIFCIEILSCVHINFLKKIEEDKELESYECLYMQQ